MIGLILLRKIVEEKRADLLLRLPKEFLEKTEREIYSYIIKYYRKYYCLPPLSEVELLPDGDHPIAYYLDQLKSRYLTKRLKKVKIEDISESEAERVIQEIIKDYNTITAKLDTEYVISEGIEDKIRDLIDRLRKAQVSGLLGYPTGFPTIDEGAGGYIPGTLFVYVARMKMGKTMYLLYSLLQLLEKGHKCMLVSMEMPFDTIMKRLLGIKYRNPNFVRQDRLVSSFGDKNLRNWNYDFHFVNGTLMKSYQEIKGLLDVYKPEILFIDGAYLLPLGFQSRSEWERVTTIVRDLNTIALSFGVPIVCTWQYNRQVSRAKEEALEYIAYTDALAQSASAVVSIFDTNSYNRKKMSILAVRDGKGGSCLVKWDWATLDFGEAIGEQVVNLPEEVVELGFEDELRAIGMVDPEELFNEGSKN